MRQNRKNMRTMMEIADLEQLVEIVRNAKVGELTLRNEVGRITIRKAATAALPSVSQEQDDQEYAYSTHYSEIIDDDDDGAEDEQEQAALITAPLVGVFGHVKPFVGLNARITEGQIVGVIEAMKIITEVKAPVTGTVVDVFIEDGHPVEFGQALYEVRAE